MGLSCFATPQRGSTTRNKYPIFNGVYPKGRKVIVSFQIQHFESFVGQEYEMAATWNEE